MNNIYITNASEEYDYWYTKTIMIIDNPKRIRVIKHDDTERFENFQVPRYQSGFKFCHRIDSDEASKLIGDYKDLIRDLQNYTDDVTNEE